MCLLVTRRTLRQLDDI